MESPATATLVPRSDLELLRVGNTILAVLLGALLVLYIMTTMYFALANAPYTWNSLPAMGSLALWLLGALAGRTRRYGQAYTRRREGFLRMTRAERTRWAIPRVAAAVAVLVLYFAFPILVGGVLWPGQGWVDDELAAAPTSMLAASAGFAAVMVSGWMDRPTQPGRQVA